MDTPHRTSARDLGQRGFVVSDWLAGLSDGQSVGLAAALLFVMASWPLLLVRLPPLQDLPNHVATAHIIAHPDLYPQYVFNGFFKSNSLLTVWLHLFGRFGLLEAARVFTGIVLAANSLALPVFIVRFAGRRSLWVGVLGAWPLVHSFFLSMGMLNFCFAFALSLILLVLIDRQRERPTGLRALAMTALAVAVWYAHPFPLLIAVGPVALYALGQPTWRARVRTGAIQLAPLAPLAVLFLLSAQQHLVKAERPHSPTERAFAYLPPWETVAHVWLDASGALTRWGSVTLLPAVVLFYFAWKRRREVRPLFPPVAVAGLAAGYLALPTMISNWWYLNCRLVPFLWAFALVRVPERLPRALAAALAAAAIWFSVALGVDYVRLDHDRAAFAAGTAVVPMRATLLPLIFKQNRTSDFTASLTHAWADYVIARNTSAPLVFAVERSYPITYREFPPAAVIAPALDQFAEKHGTAAQVCRLYRPARPDVDAECTREWHRQWADFWREAQPRFSHVLTWAMPDDARPIIPSAYHRVFVADDLEIYERAPDAVLGSHP